MSLYSIVKHIHVACVILSIAGFFARGLMMMRDSPVLGHPWLKVVPHVNDTMLLMAALALTVLTGQYPFIDAWVTAKIFGLIAYIILGSIALKVGGTKRTRTIAWLAALVAFGYVVSVALTKHPAGLFLAA